MDYDLDPLEARRLHLAGTVPFPAPFPTVGNVCICEDDPNIIVEDPVHSDNKVARTVRLKDVAAVFAPSSAEGSDYSDPFGPQFVDFENGKWYLGEQVKQVGTDSKSFPGIVFVVANAQVLSRIDLKLPAAEACLVDLPIQAAPCLGCPRR